MYFLCLFNHLPFPVLLFSTEDGSCVYRNVCIISVFNYSSMFYPALALLFALRLLRGANCVLDVVRRNYGRDGLKLYRELSKFSRKCTKVNLDIQFLLTCNVYECYPKFLRIKLYKKALYSSDIYKSFQSQLLESEISAKEKLRCHSEDRLNSLKLSAKSTFSLLLYPVILSQIEYDTQILKPHRPPYTLPNWKNLVLVTLWSPVIPIKLFLTTARSTSHKELKRS